MKSNKIFLNAGENEKEEKQSWISKIANGKKPSKKSSYGHCNAYTSVVCLKCDKCWGYSARNLEKSDEE